MKDRWNQEFFWELKQGTCIQKRRSLVLDIDGTSVFTEISGDTTTNTTGGIIRYEALELTFNSIINAPVADPTSLSDWNTFFDLPTYGGAFILVEVVGDVVKLYGGNGITLANNIFYANTNITGIDDKAKCITVIGNYSFCNCTGLVNVDFSALITAGDSSFYGCTGLVNPNFQSLTIADDFCFKDCTGLVNPDFSALTTTGYACFYGCIKLINPDFPSLNTAGNCCFFICTGLVNPNFPSLTTAGYSCFYSCVGLVNPNFSVLTTAGDACFDWCTELVNPDFSALITAGNTCFNGCTGFVNPNFPSLKTVGDECFYGCTGLTSLGLPVCTSLGSTTGMDIVFGLIISKTIILTIPSALMTCNGGSPDGDIQYLNSNNTLTIVEV